MSNQVKVVIGIVIVAALGFWGYNTSKNAPDTKQEALKETGPIKIGLSLPMTGEAASYGEGGVGGAQLAVKEINEAGGINGRMLELIVEDDQCAPATGATVAQKLTETDKVVAFFGPVCSGVGGAGLPIVQRNGVPALIIGSAPDLTKIGDYIFREYPSDSSIGKFIANFMYSTLGAKKVAVVYVKNDWGQGISDVFVPKFKEIGGDVAVTETVLQDSRDLRSAVLKIKAAKVDAIFFAVYPGNAIAGIKQIRDAGIKAPIIGGDVFVDESLHKLKEAEGVLYVQAKTNNPEEFQAKVKAVNGGKPVNIVSPYAYDAINMFAQIMKKVGTDKVAIKNELAKISYNGLAVPKVEFDENGDIKESQYEVLVIKSGKPEAYK